MSAGGTSSATARRDFCKNSFMQSYCGKNSTCKRFCGATIEGVRNVDVGLSDQDQALEAVPAITLAPSKVVAREDDSWPPVCDPPLRTTDCIGPTPTYTPVSCFAFVSAYLLFLRRSSLSHVLFNLCLSSPRYVLIGPRPSSCHVLSL